MVKVWTLEDGTQRRLPENAAVLAITLGDSDGCGFGQNYSASGAEPDGDATLTAQIWDSWDTTSDLGTGIGNLQEVGRTGSAWESITKGSHGRDGGAGPYTNRYSPVYGVAARREASLEPERDGGSDPVMYVCHIAASGAPLGNGGTASDLDPSGTVLPILLDAVEDGVQNLQSAGRRVFLDGLYLFGGSNDANGAAPDDDVAAAVGGSCLAIRRALAARLQLDDPRMPCVWAKPRWAGIAAYPPERVEIVRQVAEITAAADPYLALTEILDSERWTDNIHLSAWGMHGASARMVQTRRDAGFPLIELEAL